MTMFMAVSRIHLLNIEQLLSSLHQRSGMVMFLVTSVCPSVCNITTVKRHDVESSFLVCRYPRHHPPYSIITRATIQSPDNHF